MTSPGSPVPEVFENGAYARIGALPFDGGAQALFAAVDACAVAVLGHAHCTVNRYDDRKMELTRLYSSNAGEYPVGGTKSKAGTRWGQHVLVDGKLFVGQGASAIRDAFDDHAVIAAMGLLSVINVPVLCRGLCLGTLNFLSRTACVTEEQVAFARMLGPLAAPGLAMAGPAQQR
jgi:hypothetical protein